MKTRASKVKNRIFIPLRTQTPMINSAADSTIPIHTDKGAIHPKWKAFRYSLIFNPKPIGSIIFKNPDRINTAPVKNRLIALRNRIFVLFFIPEIQTAPPFPAGLHRQPGGNTGKYILRTKHGTVLRSAIHPYEILV